MTSSAGLLGVLGDVVILLALAAAVASPTVPQVVRPLIASLALASAWLLTAVSDALRAPAWTTLTGGGLIVVSIVVIIVTVHFWAQGGDGGESGSGHDGHGGGGPRRHQPDAPQRGGSGPSWWPEFERQFACHVAERKKENRQPAERPEEPAPYATAPLR